MQSSRSKQNWADHLIEEAKRPTKVPKNVRPPAAPQASGSVREKELRERILATDDTIAREGHESRPASIGQVQGAQVNVRTRQKLAEEAAADASTPAQRAFNERDALLQYHIDAHNERLAKEAAEETEKLRKRQAKIDAEKAEQKRAQLAGEHAVAQMNRAEICALIAHYDMWDRVPELEAIVAAEGLGKLNPLSWETACKELKHGLQY